MSNPESGFKFEALEISRNPSRLGLRGRLAILRRALPLAIAIAAFMPVTESVHTLNIPDEIRSDPVPNPVKGLGKNPPTPSK